MQPRSDAPSARDFGVSYYHGRKRFSRDYAWWRGRKIVWFPFLWELQRIARRYPAQPVAHLDAGCAYGWFLGYAHQFVGRSVGVDLSAFAIAEARRRFPHLEFVVGDVTALPFPDETFQIVTSIDTIEHVPDVSAALRELWRVTKTGGTLLLRMPYDGAYRRLLGWNDHDPTHVSVFSLPEWRRLISLTPFLIERSYPYPMFHGGNVIFRLRKAHAKAK